MARERWIAGVLFAGTLAVYARALDVGFIRLDDWSYVLENPHVRGGLDGNGLVWAFTTGRLSNWHPLTWLSHMLDVELFGLDAVGHHATNVLLHAVDVLLVFHVLRIATRAVWASAGVAALFALHPLHVESVVWVAERKDVLSALFWLLATWAYVVWVRRGGTARYGLVALLLALGLLAKPMVVTLPLVLLLLDVWPLARREPWRRLVAEKLPLLALSLGAGVATLFAQRAGGALEAGTVVPLADRLANAVVTWPLYVGKLLWPARLSILYPHPYLPGGTPWTAVEVALGAALLLVASALAVAALHRRPYVFVGWLWLLVTLAPVIGIVQAGTQGMADRYTYLPSIGLFLAAAFGCAELVARRPTARAAMLAGAAAVVAACAAASWVRLGDWQDEVVLYRRSLAAAPGSEKLHNNLANELYERGDVEGAIEHYREAVRIFPDYAVAHRNLGNALRDEGRPYEAALHFLRARRADVESAAAQLELGGALLSEGRLDEAIAHYRRAAERADASAATHRMLGHALRLAGRLDGAIEHYRRALELDPDVPGLRDDLDGALRERGAR